ncbi:MAG: TIM barrel protein [Bryobacterales bacterium]|jgi:hydroxypyruvate isomerase|nr:TIM barrel protein [Bryobacterales bacterium]
MTRRDWIHQTIATGTLLVGAEARTSAAPLKGRIKQGVTRGVFRRPGNPMTFDEMCRICADLGVVGFDLVGPKDFPVLKKYGLVPSMVPGGSGIKKGINDPAQHAEIEPRMREAIREAAAAKAPNVIVLSGDREGISDQQGLETSAAFMRKVMPQAEDAGVTMCIELLNSKVDHPGYMCDRTAWGVELCKAIGSPRFKLLYDIYHMQIMEGDIIRTIKENIQYIGHFHTAGNPGRNEFDETQELNYRPIIQAIVDTGFSGFLSHEYGAKKDPVLSLKKSLEICDV